MKNNSDMEGNSPGKKRERSRSRGRSSLSSRVNFFEQWTTGQSPSADWNHHQQERVASEVFDQSSVDQLERQMEERRREMMAQPDVRQVVTLRSVTSPVRSPPPTSPQSYTTEVFLSSWGDRVQSPDPQDAQPPWRLARRSEPSSSETHGSSFGVPTSPTLALTKYQEWRARRFTDTTPPEPSVPWRKHPAQRSSTSDAVLDFRTQRSRQPSESELSVSSSSSLSSSRRGPPHHQPQWYSDFRTASMTQAATRLDTFRAGVNTHYDFHISQIKGIRSGWATKKGLAVSVAHL